MRRHPSPTLFPYPTLFRSQSLVTLGLLETIDAMRSTLARLAAVPAAVILLAAHAAMPALAAPGEFTVVNNTSFAISELRSEEHTSELQSRFDLVCRLMLE